MRRGPIDHPSYGIARCREVIAVAVSQIDGDPIVGDRLVDPALEITVAHIEEIVALQCAAGRYPMTHENAEDLTANVLVGKSVRHGHQGSEDTHQQYANARSPSGDQPFPESYPLLHIPAPEQAFVRCWHKADTQPMSSNDRFRGIKQT